MISIAVEDVKATILSFLDDVEAHRKNLVRKLKELKEDTTDPLEVSYLEALLSDADVIITADPAHLERLKGKYEEIIDTKLLADGKYSSFRDSVIGALSYRSLRSNFYPEYFYRIGIKTCVYCNSQLAVSVIRDSTGDYRAKFQVDHYLPKDKYPCFSISLFNLYPVCASCNNVKGSKSVLFTLYQQRAQITTSPFHFSITPASQGLFLVNRKPEQIEIVFTQPPLQHGYEDYNKLFDIKSTYETQRDIAEELLIKAEIYSPRYKKTLLQQFNKLFKREDIIDRLIIGNYTEEEDTHKRPLAKFMMDISQEIGLINRVDKRK